MKRLTSIVLVLIMLLSIGCIAVSAKDEGVVTTSSTTYFDDGSYLVTTVTSANTNSSARATKTKSGSKTDDYYSSSDRLLWSVTINGTYTYTGSKATCTKATTSTVVYDSDWKVTSATASKSGNKATGNFTVKRYFLGVPTATKERVVTLTCSATGVLS